VDSTPPAAPMGRAGAQVTRRAGGGPLDVLFKRLHTRSHRLPGGGGDGRDIPTARRPLSVWHERLLTRADEVAAELATPPLSGESSARVNVARQWLKESKDIIESESRWRGAFSGVAVEAAREKIEAAEFVLARLSGPETLKAKLPSIIADAQEVLRKDDPRMICLRKYAGASALDKQDCETIAQCLKALYIAHGEQTRRLRNFRNIVLGTTVALTIFAVILGVVGLKLPSAIYLGAAPSSATTRADIFGIELLGLFSACLVGSVAIRQIRGTSTPYAIPTASLLLKLPTGALTAVAGVLLIRAGILGPELAAMTGPRLLAYAMIFGASQQTFTRLIDRQAQNVLNNVSTTDRDAAKDQ
jgi:hypothetical protein